MTALPGLSTCEARQLLARDGPNVLPRVRPVPRWRRIAAEFIHFFALMLWAAALAFLAGMPELGIAILLVVVDGVFAYRNHPSEQEPGPLVTAWGCASRTSGPRRRG